jgi:hypothetical protein
MHIVIGRRALGAALLASRRRQPRPQRGRGARSQPLLGAPLPDRRSAVRDFTKATGIKINRIEAGDEQLLDRIRSEGAQSPADILLIVDAARLWSAQQQGCSSP